MKYYSEKWDDIMGMDYEQFLFRLNDMNRVKELELKAMKQLK